MRFDKVELLVAKSQSRRKYTDGHKVRVELAGKPVLNACVLNLLLGEQHLIPEGWREKVVCFWGTIYRDSRDDLCIRTLYSGVDRWISDYLWLYEDYLTDDYPAALRSG